MACYLTTLSSSSCVFDFPIPSQPSRDLSIRNPTSSGGIGRCRKWGEPFRWRVSWLFPFSHSPGPSFRLSVPVQTFVHTRRDASGKGYRETEVPTLAQQYCFRFAIRFAFGPSPRYFTHSFAIYNHGIYSLSSIVLSSSSHFAYDLPHRNHVKTLESD